VTTGWRNSRRDFSVEKDVSRIVPVDAIGPIAPRDLARFRIALRELRTLGGVLEWLRLQEPPRIVQDIVTQDEYTHDVVVPWSERLILVFDAT
jgi:hypothetical protein